LAQAEFDFWHFPFEPSPYDPDIASCKFCRNDRYAYFWPVTPLRDRWYQFDHIYGWTCPLPDSEIQDMFSAAVRMAEGKLFLWRT
jgi:hypothetical protein